MGVKSRGLIPMIIMDPPESRVFIYYAYLFECSFVTRAAIICRYGIQIDVMFLLLFYSFVQCLQIYSDSGHCDETEYGRSHRCDSGIVSCHSRSHVSHIR